ncbi:MAG: hypothetical protein Q8K96_03810 [Rubrivivax sp.]|nr:hypothetical protein [Rubrivivax sp.]
MNAALGWGLAAAAVVAGWMGYGWRGVVLAASVIVFWLLLEFSRALRVMRQASARPVGRVPSAVMLHARLHAGMRLPAILKITRSLGRQRADQPETFGWIDDAGDEVEIELRDGRVTAWRLRRAGGDGS